MRRDRAYRCGRGGVRGPGGGAGVRGDRGLRGGRRRVGARRRSRRRAVRAPRRRSRVGPLAPVPARRPRARRSRRRARRHVRQAVRTQRGRGGRDAARRGARGFGAPPELRAPLHTDARAAPRPGVGGCRGHPRARPVDARQRQLPRPPAPARLVVPARARWRVDRRVGFPRGRHAALDVRRDHGRAGRLPDHDPGTPRPRRPAATV